MVHFHKIPNKNFRITEFVRIGITLTLPIQTNFMRKFFLLVAGIFLLNNLFAQISPKEHFGFTIGDDYQLANFTQTAEYFKKISEQSDRVKLMSIGLTEEGRTQPMLIVSSPENLKNLEQYKEISQKLARAENLSEAEARLLSEKGKAIVWIDGGLHSNETLGIHQLIETLWNLLSRKDAETMRILDNTIILLTHANPDGHELVSNWYMREEIPENRSLENLPHGFCRIPVFFYNICLNNLIIIC
jgi:hypothetical protein